MKNRTVLSLVCLVLVATGCAPQNKTQQGGVYGAAGGAAAGAVVGQVVGRSTAGTLTGAAIGAAIGGLGGAGVGRMMDNQERDMRQVLAQSEAATVRREGNLLAIAIRGDLSFDTNSTVVRPGLYREIDRVANVLNDYPETVIRVEGHTDSVGSESFNQDLSNRRAAAVRDLFVQRGINPSRIETMGFGESRPIATNETESGRMQNRRVEIMVAPQQY